MFNKLKQIKDLKNKAKTLQNKLAEETVEGSGNWGKVKIKMDGNQKVLKVDINPELLSPNSKEKLESALKDAFEDAVKKIQKIMFHKMKDMGGDFNLPGLN